MAVGRVDAIKCIRRVARRRNRVRIGFCGCLQDEGVETIGVVTHEMNATLFGGIFTFLECENGWLEVRRGFS